jgi:hypothetical protein
VTRRRYAPRVLFSSPVIALTALLTLLLAVSGCAAPAPSSGSATTSGHATDTGSVRACADAAAALVTAVGRAVAGYDQPKAGTSPQPATTAGTSTVTPTPTTSETTAGSADPSSDLGAAAAAARAAISRYGCQSGTFKSDLEAGLNGVETHTAIAAAVLARLTAGLTGQVAQQAETRQLTPADDLAQVLAQVAPGSTLILQAGTYSITRSLVFLDGVTVRGAGRDTTQVKASAPDAALVVMTAGLVEISDLRIELDAAVPASGIVAAPQSLLKLSAMSVSGATATPAGLGGAGVQMSGSATDGPARATTLEVTDSQFDHNAWAGIAVGGGHRASILRGSFTGNGQCGACFLDVSSGSVQDSRFTDDVVALGANAQARPTWVGNTVTGGTVGVQLDGGATPTIQNLTVTGASRAAVIFSGRSGGALTGVTCTSVPYGIVVADTAAPTLGESSCQVARGG